ncbi:MAG: hypothetical protein SGPRY_003565 [Prymnesium sp.]
MARLRLLSTAASEGGSCVRLYRWRWVREARIVLRLKLLQMGAAASLLLPVGGALASGAHVGGVEVAAGAGLAGGVYGLARTLGWLCDRLVGELAWKEGVLRISTLSMASRLHNWGDSLPPRGMVNLSLEGTNYLLFAHKQHVAEPEALGRLLSGKQPFVDEMDRKSQPPSSNQKQSL